MAQKGADMSEPIRPEASATSIEVNGINVIAEDERKGQGTCNSQLHFVLPRASILI